MVHHKSLLVESLWLTHGVAITCVDLVSVRVLVWLPACSVKEGEASHVTTYFGLRSGASGHKNFITFNAGVELVSYIVLIIRNSMDIASKPFTWSFLHPFR